LRGVLCFCPVFLAEEKKTNMKVTRTANRCLCTFHAAILIVALNVSAFGQMGGSPPPEKTIAVYGQNIHYIEAGQGPAVILLHGLGATKEAWSANFTALASKYHVYALDQLGSGHSDKPLIDYTIATWADFLQGFMQSQNIPKATVVGNSLGGWIATEFAVQHPEKVDKLVLVDAAGLAGKIRGFPADISVDLNPSTIAAWRTLLDSVFYDKTIVTDEVATQLFTNRMRNNDGYTIERALAGFAARPQFEDDKLRSIHAPTLVVWGRNDELISVDRAEKFGSGIPGAKVVVFEQCGHVPQIEKAEEFNRTLLEFLGR
jgi:pimeloyl-ACP methyl ester carboxylesterase